MPINAEALAAGESDVDIVYRGQQCKVWYRTNAITKEYKARAFRMDREAKRIERRRIDLQTRIEAIVAPDNTPEAAAEDEAAEVAITQLLIDDEAMKKALDSLIAESVTRWEVYRRDGSMLPLDAESLFPVSAEFEGLILSAVSQASNMGEVTGPNSLTSLPLPLRPRDAQEVGPQSQSFTTTSSPANGALPSSPGNG